LTRWLLIICALCTSLNVFGALYLGSQRVGNAPSRDEPLSRPNQFIGLNLVDRNKPGVKPPGPIATYPLLLAQVSPTQPRRVLPYANRRSMTEFGTVQTNDRFFAVNYSVRC
jgi:hypothetical protein